jgi:fibro-slime domain-containing protein
MRTHGRRLIAALVIGLALAPAATMADELQLTGTIRDLKRGDQTGGHPDFETCETVAGHGAFGHVVGLTAMQLGPDGKPAFNPARPGNDSMQSAASFSSWYNDTPGVNLSMPYTITLSNSPSNPGVYSYENAAFFPIDGKLLGDQGQKDANGVVHNFSFTYEVHSQFAYRPGQSFTFVGDDDVWVYFNSTKCLDLGGVHAAVTGTVVMLDGKAFITNQGGSSPSDTSDQKPFPVGGAVQSVTAAQATQYAALWASLGLPGTCPIVEGKQYIDLNLNAGGPDVVCAFSGTGVAVKAGAALKTVVLLFSDGTQQQFPGLTGTTGTFSGTGAYASKTIAGAYVTAGNVTGTVPYFGADGSGGADCSMAFFFAERHTTESHFRIDTSMLLKSAPSGTIMPLYD